MERYDEITSLRAEMAAMRRELRQVRQRRAWWRFPVALLCVVALAAMPLGVLGANFIDLNPGSGHNADINLIADAGISRGCGDTLHYCPNDLVTREQMASFLARTAGLGGNPPVTNAATLNGWPAHALVRTTGNANGTTPIGVFNGVYQTVTSATINVPAPGFVYAVGAVNVYAGAGSSSAYAFVRLRDIGSGLVSYPLNAYVGTGAGHTYETAISNTAVFPAPAGNRTYALDVGRDNASFGATGAYPGVITLIYIPFGAGGFQAAAEGGVQVAEGTSPLLPEAPPGERPER